MSKIQIIKCGMCEKDIKTGFTDTENYTFYEMHLVHRDLAKEYYEEFQDTRAGRKLIRTMPICEECFEKLLNKDIIKENEKLKMQNQELLKEKYQLINDLL